MRYNDATRNHVKLYIITLLRNYMLRESLITICVVVTILLSIIRIS